MQSHDRHYFLDRERQERAVAERCDDVTARRVHLELANRYRERAEQPASSPPQAA